jgi:magnesium transporter
MPKHYGAETVNSIMSKNVPTCRPDDTQSTLVTIVGSRKWDSVHNVYVLNDHGKLVGTVLIDKLLRAAKDAKASDIMHQSKAILHPGDDQEKAVFAAIHNDIIAIPVTDENDHFVGVVTAWSIIDVMHEEHAEDALMTAGIHGKASNIVKLATERTLFIVKNRAPWLVFGLVVGLGLGLISSFFESQLQANVAIAYFIPVVAYIADSVGTQSEAIAVRALATLKINPALYLFKELLVGAVLGTLMGLLGGVGAYFIAGSLPIGVAVGVSLLVASLIAASLASAIPMMFKALGKDPALGSGPLATAIQDVISIIVYFVFATWLVS